MEVRAFKIKCEHCNVEQYVSSEGKEKVYCGYCGQFTKVEEKKDEK